jgi:hypothetical protein
MKTILMTLAMAVAISIAAIPLTRCSAADEVVAFGLTNRSINSAALFLDPEYHDLRVTNLSTLGYKGVSVRLGQAESGLFFSPYTRASLQDDNFMIGHAYGLMDGITRRISSVFCRRDGYANYPVTVDFLPLGTVSKTVQFFVDYLLVGEETYTNGVVAISTSNSSNIGPRVNPFWRMPDGSVGVLLEFTGNPPISLPSGRTTYANRLFIRANHPLFTVDYVSRVDVYGGGGLPEFSSIDERLGMFGRPHRALGGAVFTAKQNELTIGNCSDAGTDGVFIELNASPAFRVQFQPVSLGSNGALFHVSATGTGIGSYRYGSTFFGPLGIENHDGEKRLRVDAPDANPWSVRIEVVDGAVLSGGFITTNSGFIGSFGTNNLDIISAGVLGGVDDQLAALSVEFREPATLTAGDQILRGNIVRISPVSLVDDIATFASFQVLACDVPPFTITNEVAAPTPPVVLAIERFGTNAVVSWPAFASYYTYLETTHSLAPGEPWNYDSGQELPFIRSQARTRFPIVPTQDLFFRLHNPYAQIFEPYVPD